MHESYLPIMSELRWLGLFPRRRGLTRFLGERDAIQVPVNRAVDPGKATNHERGAYRRQAHGDPCGMERSFGLKVFFRRVKPAQEQACIACGVKKP